MRFECPEDCFQIFFSQKVLFFYHFLTLSRIFLTSGLVFFGTFTESAFYVYVGKNLWIFPEHFSFFSILRLWAENFPFWQNLVAGLSKLLFYVYRRALWRQIFGRRFIFSSISDNGQFSLLLEKRLLEWLSTLQSTFTGERSGNMLVFKLFSISLGFWVKKGLIFSQRFSASLSKLHSNLPDKQFEKDFVSRNVWFVLSL